MESLTTQQLEHMKERGDDFVLINVLPEEDFRKAHIPGSINIPVADKNFLARVETEAGSRDRKIVVYCANKECSASPKAAKMLEASGFTNVFDYQGGVREWQDKGRPLEAMT
jgi:rhodanese-related sulfurtransferase